MYFHRSSLIALFLGIWALPSLAQSNEYISVAFAFDDSTIVPLGRFQEESWLDLRWKPEKWSNYESGVNWFCPGAEKPSVLNPSKVLRHGVPGYDEEMVLVVEATNAGRSGDLLYEKRVECSLMFTTPNSQALTFTNQTIETEEGRFLHAALDSIYLQLQEDRVESYLAENTVPDSAVYIAWLPADELTRKSSPEIKIRKSDPSIEGKSVYHVQVEKFYRAKPGCSLASIQGWFYSANAKDLLQSASFELFVGSDCDGKGGMRTRPMAAFIIESDIYVIYRETMYGGEGVGVYKVTEGGFQRILSPWGN